MSEIEIKGWNCSLFSILFLFLFFRKANALCQFVLLWLRRINSSIKKKSKKIEHFEYGPLIRKLCLFFFGEYLIDRIKINICWFYYKTVLFRCSKKIASDLTKTCKGGYRNVCFWRFHSYPWPYWKYYVLYTDLLSAFFRIGRIREIS